jgi:structural maintenance of chromosomes protein 5
VSTQGLSQLNNQTQSGGERAVTTAFFILALQGQAQTPFTLVDEINQGMDARNERMVHSRMVDIACQEHKNQLFVVTPKLLQGLRYGDGVNVMVIANGKGVPNKSEQVDFANVLSLQKRIIAAAA